MPAKSGSSEAWNGRAEPETQTYSGVHVLPLRSHFARQTLDRTVQPRAKRARRPEEEARQLNVKAQRVAGWLLVNGRLRVDAEGETELIGRESWGNNNESRANKTAWELLVPSRMAPLANNSS